MLTVKSFIDLMGAKHQEESEPFFPVLAAEEPEAHLHPNAQKTLYRQLSESKGQLIVSTHSPYLVAMAKPAELRFLRRDKDNVISVQLSTDLDQEDLRRLQREIIHSRGEILFTKALVLCEGETEEQALPLLFHHYFKNESFQLDVNFVGVGGSGKKYRPFLSFSKDLLVPAFIFSDGEESTVKDLKKHYTNVFGQTDIMTCPNITILDNTDFEGYLISSGYKQIIEEAIKEVDGDDAITNWIDTRHGTSQGRIKTDSPPCSECKQPIYSDNLRDYKSQGGYDNALLDILDSKKPKYAPVIALKLCELEPEKIPPKIIELFQNIRKGAF
jgi:putative ATP-dependent endonuclease of OLD family